MRAMWRRAFMRVFSKGGSGIPPQKLLRLNSPPPSNTWVGVYLDDLLVTQRVKRGDLVEGARRLTLEADEHCGATAKGS